MSLRTVAADTAMPSFSVSALEPTGCPTRTYSRTIARRIAPLRESSITYVSSGRHSKFSTRPGQVLSAANFANCPKQRPRHVAPEKEATLGQGDGVVSELNQPQPGGLLQLTPPAYDRILAPDLGKASTVEAAGEAKAHHGRLGGSFGVGERLPSLLDGRRAGYVGPGRRQVPRAAAVAVAVGPGPEAEVVAARPVAEVVAGPGPRLRPIGELVAHQAGGGQQPGGKLVAVGLVVVVGGLPEAPVDPRLERRPLLDL